MSAYEKESSRRYVQINSLLRSDARWSEKIIALGFALGSQKNSILNTDSLFEQAIQLQRRAVSLLKQDADNWDTPRAWVTATDLLYRLINNRLENQNRERSVALLADLDQAVLHALEQGFLDSNLPTTIMISMEYERYQVARQIAAKLDTAIQPMFGFWQAEILRREGKVKEAQQVADQWVEKMPQEPNLLFHKATFVEGLGLNYWAAYLLKKKMAPSATPNILLMKLAELEFRLGEYQTAQLRAAAVFSETKERQYKLRSAQLLADYARLKQQPQAEVRWLSQILKIDPLSSAALVRTYHASKALETFDQLALRKKTDIAKGAYRDQFRLGSQMAQSSTPAEANLGRTKMGTAANSMAWLLGNLGEETDEALRMGEVAVNLEPYNSDYLDTLAFCEFRYGKKSRALALQERAVALAPNDREKVSRLKIYQGNR